MRWTATADRLRRVCLRARGEGGFTLAELLVAMAILVVIVASLTSVLITASTNQLDANNRFQAQGQARAGLDELRRELHCAGSVTVTKNGSAVGAGVAGDAVNTQLSSVCPTTGGQNLYVTWCTAPSTLTTGDSALYRVTSTTAQPTCGSTGKVKWADYLTTSTPFCLPTSSVACNGVLNATMALPTLHVTMPVNLNGPSSTIDGYNLVDDIALRNGTRS